MDNYVVVCVCLLGCVATVALVITDPCSSYLELPRAEYRGGQCNFDIDKEVCDRTLTSGWYRAIGIDGDLEMQESEASFMTCGTKFPYWMNGTHPSIEDGEVTREVCQTGILGSCEDSETIRVKNCGTYYVYELGAVPACSSAYCFGASDSCPPFDPCDIYENTRIEYDPGRSSICKQHGSSNCDSFDNSTWYSFRDILFDYLNITMQCPNTVDACGTKYPLYITGTNSGTVQTDGSIETNVCEQDYPHCCKRQFTIWSKECKGFTVYKFPNPPTGICNRYCLDESTAVCPTTTPSTTSTTVEFVTEATSQTSQVTQENAGTNLHVSINDNGDDKKILIIVVAVVAPIAIIAVAAILVVTMVMNARGKISSVSKEVITTSGPEILPTAPPTKL